MRMTATTLKEQPLTSCPASSSLTNLLKTNGPLVPSRHYPRHRAGFWRKRPFILKP
jgi:hypothetical protein